MCFGHGSGLDGFDRPLWGACAVPALCLRCGTRKAILDPFPPHGHGDRSHYRVPRHTGLPQTLPQSKTSDNELRQSVFPTKIAGSVSKSAGCCPVDVAPPGGEGGDRGGHGHAHSLWGAVRARCRTAPFGVRQWNPLTDGP
uniref:Uncharacterized protein n=1 Tax=Eutreptiella gymnastica TaxID=73025 RepID=A0A7S4LE92_9EUGL|mmetsp:Transcript_50242/g.84068  ORF Transcript_50242/g.84068 Transcript_50242/m.84068 type:complete len:141 (-) Transcript_50242:378-800(-)